MIGCPGCWNPQTHAPDVKPEQPGCKLDSVMQEHRRRHLLWWRAFSASASSVWKSPLHSPPKNSRRMVGYSELIPLSVIFKNRTTEPRDGEKLGCKARTDALLRWVSSGDSQN